MSSSFNWLRGWRRDRFLGMHPIEGACRHLIKDRMDLTGARWGLERAEAVLKLRSMKSSGDFQAYWKFHQTEELKRNHVSRYESFPLPMAA